MSKFVGSTGDTQNGIENVYTSIDWVNVSPDKIEAAQAMFGPVVFRFHRILRIGYGSGITTFLRRRMRDDYLTIDAVLNGGLTDIRVVLSEEALKLLAGPLIVSIEFWTPDDRFSVGVGIQFGADSGPITNPVTGYFGKGYYTGSVEKDSKTGKFYMFDYPRMALEGRDVATDNMLFTCDWDANPGEIEATDVPDIVRYVNASGVYVETSYEVIYADWNPAYTQPADYVEPQSSWTGTDEFFNPTAVPVYPYPGYSASSSYSYTYYVATENMDLSIWFQRPQEITEATLASVQASDPPIGNTQVFYVPQRSENLFQTAGVPVPVYKGKRIYSGHWVEYRLTIDDIMQAGFIREYRVVGHEYPPMPYRIVAVAWEESLSQAIKDAAAANRLSELYAIIGWSQVGAGFIELHDPLQQTYNIYRLSGNPYNGYFAQAYYYSYDYSKRGYARAQSSAGGIAIAQKSVSTTPYPSWWLGYL